MVKERTFFLDLFLKQCCQHQYLVQSPEFQLFLRPTEPAKLEADLKKMFAKKTQEQLAIYRKTVPINENYSDNDVKVFE